MILRKRDDTGIGGGSSGSQSDHGESITVMSPNFV
jgi:hypothetical protein